MGVKVACKKVRTLAALPVATEPTTSQGAEGLVLSRRGRGLPRVRVGAARDRESPKPWAACASLTWRAGQVVIWPCARWWLPLPGTPAGTAVARTGQAA